MGVYASVDVCGRPLSSLRVAWEDRDVWVQAVYVQIIGYKDLYCHGPYILVEGAWERSTTSALRQCAQERFLRRLRARDRLSERSLGSLGA